MPPKKDKVYKVKLVKGKTKRKGGKSKPKEKSRQKQKQRQTVNVQVSSGGSGGGGTSFIPMPQAPAFDYSLLANLIRPANTVDVPIRAAAPMAESIATRPAETQTLADDLPMGGSESESEVPIVKARKVRKDAGQPRKKEPQPIPSGEYERMIEAQKMGGGGGEFI